MTNEILIGIIIGAILVGLRIIERWLSKDSNADLAEIKTLVQKVQETQEGQIMSALEKIAENEALILKLVEKQTEIMQEQQRTERERQNLRELLNAVELSDETIKLKRQRVVGE